MLFVVAIWQWSNNKSHELDSLTLHMYPSMKLTHLTLQRHQFIPMFMHIVKQADKFLVLLFQSFL